MKVIRFVVPTAIVVLALVACLQSTTPTVVPPTEVPTAEPTANVPLTVQAAVDATLAAQPTDTPGPNIRATVEAAVQATLTAEAGSAEEELASARERPYRSIRRPPDSRGSAGTTKSGATPAATMTPPKARPRPRSLTPEPNVWRSAACLPTR